MRGTVRDAMKGGSFVERAGSSLFPSYLLLPCPYIHCYSHGMRIIIGDGCGQGGAATQRRHRGRAQEG